MKKIIVLGLFTFMIGQGFSQTTTATTENTATTATAKSGKDEKKQFIESLNLTKEQKVKFQQWGKNGKSEKNKIAADSSLNAGQKKDKIKELRKSQKAKLKEILTPEQFTQYESAQKKEAKSEE